MSELETMAYKMQPAGHEGHQRRTYEKPCNKLATEFEKWLTKTSDRATEIRNSSGYAFEEHYSEFYTTAEKTIEKLEISVDQAHGLLLQYQDHPLIDLSGFFISAMYNKTPEKIIVIDTKLNHPDCFLGYKLTKDKTLVNLSDLDSENVGYYAEGTLVNLGKIGDRFGSASLGVLLNYGIADIGLGISVGKSKERANEALVMNFGETGEDLGRAARCPVINFGKAGERLGNESRALVVNCGETGDMMAVGAECKIVPIRKPNGRICPDRGTIVYDKELLPKLGAYFEQMRKTFEKGRNDYREALAALETLGPKPGAKVMQDVDNILGGKDV